MKVNDLISVFARNNVSQNSEIKLRVDLHVKDTKYSTPIVCDINSINVSDKQLDLIGSYNDMPSELDSFISIIDEKIIEVNEVPSFVACLKALKCDLMIMKKKNERSDSYAK